MDYFTSKWFISRKNGIVHVKMDYFTLKWIIWRQNGLFHVKVDYFMEKWIISHQNGLFHVKMDYFTSKWIISWKNGLFHVKMDNFMKNGLFPGKMDNFIIMYWLLPWTIMDRMDRMVKCFANAHGILSGMDWGQLYGELWCWASYWLQSMSFVVFVFSIFLDFTVEKIIHMVKHLGHGN